MKQVFTIGHSTRTIEDFVNILNCYEIVQIIDVRSIPGSNYAPQFNRENLKKSLKADGILYTYMQGLGGFRPTFYDSPNTGWKNKSFRGYADYMQSEDFRKNLDELIKKIEQRTSAVLCAELLPWRCHRSLIADALTIRGFQVFNIISEKNCYMHKLTEFAQVEGYKITYPFKLPML